MLADLESSEDQSPGLWTPALLLGPHVMEANSGDAGSVPDLGRSHMLQSNYTHAPLLNLCSRAQEAQHAP